MSIGIAIDTVTNVAASSSCQRSWRLAMIHAASGRNSATSSGTACGVSPSSSTEIGMPSCQASVEACAAEHVGLGAEREQRRGHHEQDRALARPVVERALPARVLLGLHRQRAAGDESGDACEAVQGEHERVAKQDVADVAERPRPDMAGQRQPRHVGRRVARDDVGRQQQAEADRRTRRAATGAATSTARRASGAASSGCPGCPGRGRSDWGPSPEEIGLGACA